MILSSHSTSSPARKKSSKLRKSSDLLLKCLKSETYDKFGYLVNKKTKLPTPGPVSRNCPDTFRAKANFFNQNLLNSSTFPSSQTNFASLTDSFILPFSKLLQPWSWMQTRHGQTPYSSSGPKSYRDFRLRNRPMGTVYIDQLHWSRVVESLERMSLYTFTNR